VSVLYLFRAQKLTADILKSGFQEEETLPSEALQPLLDSLSPHTFHTNPALCTNKTYRLV